MDKISFCDTVALETARAFVSSNMPEYINNSGTEGFAKDFSQKYLEAYQIANKYYTENHIKYQF
jgi:hypothetical protein